jgi:microcin C transport system substrate-binding protein
MKKIARLFPFLLLVACGKSGGPPASTDAGPAVADAPVQMETAGEADPIADSSAVHGGTFASWQGPYPKSLNGWLDTNSFSVTVSGLMFQDLVDLHSTKDEPVGDLAQTWEISPDKQTFTFHLDPNAKWSDGTPVTAADVVFYYDVIMNPKNLTSSYRVDLGKLNRPVAVDDHTLRVTAKGVHWNNFWIAGGLAAFPRQVWTNVNFNNINFDFPVVDGPYSLYKVDTNQSIILQRRGDWWGRAQKYNQYKYNFDYLVFKAMEDRTAALEVMKTGGFDQYAIYTALLWATETENIPAVQKNWIVRQAVYNAYPVSFQGLALNMRRPIFKDLRVREAMAYLLDRQTMNDKFMFDEYFLLNSYFPSLYPNYQNRAVPVTPYDPNKARELLTEAGWTVGPDGILQKDGQPFDITIIHYEGSDLRHLTLYQQDLQKVGIRLHIKIISEANFTEEVNNFQFDLIWQNWDASRLLDPEQMWSSKTADDIATMNYPGFKNPQVDSLIEEQKTELDLGKRNDIDRQIDGQLAGLYPYVLMWEPDNHRLLYWNRFGTPKYVLSKYGDERDAFTYWWYDPAKAAALDDAMKRNVSLPALPAEVHYGQ